MDMLRNNDKRGDRAPASGARKSCALKNKVNCFFFYDQIQIICYEVTMKGVTTPQLQKQEQHVAYKIK